MLQLRPTFSESWYRVATLKPRLRAGAQMSRQYFRDERWYVVRDPAGNQFHRLSDPAYRFVGLLDGRRTVAEAWDLVGGQLADDAPTQPEVIQILSQLYAANLLETNITPDATVLLRRHKQMSQRKFQSRLMNILFPRIPLWDPDRFLRLWLPVARVLFSKLGAIVWLIAIGAAIFVLAPKWNDLQVAGHHAFDLQNNLENIAYLYLTFVFIKLIHELGHAFACRRFGGECHELGLMLLVFVPTPYVDASTAWAFPNKWHRVFVGAAGMIVELFFASICAFVWAYTSPATSPLINQLAYNAMFIASVSTIIFNANPLLRYDGYYILSDWLEIPNLRQKSTDYTLGLLKRYVFRLKLTQPLPPLGQCIWLFVYAVTSTAYRIFVGLMIMLIVTYKIPVLGVLMGIGALITWMAVPVVQVLKYLLLNPELHRKRTRAIGFSAAVAVVLVVLIGLIRFPVHVDFTGIVQPDDPHDDRGRVTSGALKTGGSGRVIAINAHDGDTVYAGQVILELTSPDIDHQLDVVNAHREEIDARIRQARVMDQNELAKDRADQKVWDDELDEVHRRQDDLKVKAPFTGTLIAPKLKEMVDGYLPRGLEIGRVAVLSKLVVKGDITQQDAELAEQFPNHKVEVRLAGLPVLPLKGRNVKLFPAASYDMADAALGSGAGGDIVADPHDPRGKKSQVGTFEARVDIDNNDENFYPGQRAYVRLTLDSQPLIRQWTRRVLQIIQAHDTGKWL